MNAHGLTIYLHLSADELFNRLTNGIMTIDLYYLINQMKKKEIPY